MRNISFSAINNPAARNETLDILRFIAVSLVLFRHMPNPEIIKTLPAVLGYPLKVLNEIGWIGVDLFFVLSGFLVSGLIFQEIKNKKGFNIKRFLLRRGFKIYPSFYLLIGITVAVALASKKNIYYSQVLSEVFFYQNYVPGLWNHTWSLAVEEHFYFLLAFLLWFLVKKQKTSLFPYICFIIFGICPALRIYYASGHEFAYIPSLTATHFRIDSLFMGSILKYLQIYRPAKFVKIQHLFIKNWPLAAIFALFLPWYFPLTSSFFMPTIGFSILAIISGVILVGLLNVSWHFKLWRIIAIIGGCSYPIYLFHMPCKFWPKAIIERGLSISMSPSFDLAVYFFSAFALGILISRLIELPLLVFRNRIIK